MALVQGPRGVDGEADAEWCVGVGRVRGGAAEDHERPEVATPVHLVAEQPLGQPGRVAAVLPQRPGEAAEFAPVAVLEEGVAGVRGAGAEDVGAAHAEHQRPDPPAAVPGDAAVLRRGEGAVAGVDVGDDVLGDVVLVTAGGARVDELAAAVAGRAVDEGVDARRRRRLRGVEVLEPLEDRRLEEVAVAPLLDARAVSGEHIDHRKPPLGVVVVARRKPHQQPPARGVAEGVAGEGGAVDRVVDEPAPARRGTERLGGKRPRHGWHRGHCAA